MLSIKYIRENIDLVKESAKNKNSDVNLDEIVKLDENRREIIKEADDHKAKRNVVSQAIAQKKRNGENSDQEISDMRMVSDKIKELDGDLKIIEEKLHSCLLYVPNVIHPSVPIGFDESDNVTIREWGELPEYSFGLQDHLEIGENLKLFDFKRASKISGSGFPLYTGIGAKLERSLINYMLDLHTEKHGYTELFPPFLTNRDATQTTGQLPKFAEDMYHIPADDLFCISTAEVPVTNIHKDETLLEDDLPKKYSAYSACFRREAGSYGKETRGLLRVHQFNKVEMVKFVKPEESYEELEKLLVDAEEVLQSLNLHYRVRALASGDLSFAAAKCFDIEVWAPGMQKYLEVSSCSNFQDFQARRGNIRYRRKSDNKVDFVHTLNGSGVATPRLMIALLETYQQDDGSVIIPKVLQPYLKADILLP
ncbi:MAG: serine--tRNA ligase [Candidatus Marinimicrobia bacterium]|nr:serine--tRNA ligase [Candidatus Neomarinimicrobiota bacterium]MBL7023337.1 serine--tRNA ligase [Candidatus Neomarinimicrobiota bacterium]MBL7109296.1 serine--tRNA ligase [Candidatus Neomarinimicrobiota bacterium]